MKKMAFGLTLAASVLSFANEKNNDVFEFKGFSLRQTMVDCPPGWKRVDSPDLGVRRMCHSGDQTFAGGKVKNAFITIFKNKIQMIGLDEIADTINIEAALTSRFNKKGIYHAEINGYIWRKSGQVLALSDLGNNKSRVLITDREAGRMAEKESAKAARSDM